MKRTLILLVALSLAWGAALTLALARDDNPLDPDYYFMLPGLDGRGGVCTDEYDGADSSNDTGVVGISQFITGDHTIKMQGAVQPLYDDGRTTECAREVQTYTVVSRSGSSFPGLTNTMIGFRLPSLCAGGDAVCQWSTPFAGAVSLPAGDAIDAMSEEDKNSVPIQFPSYLGWELVNDKLGGGEGAEYIDAIYYGWLGKDHFNDDIIFVVQHVYKPEDSPYFDITWEIKAQNHVFEEAKFWQVIDTFTGGNDYGFGYLCDVSKISGGTGGSAFFQGVIALHPSGKQYEGWWAKVFEKVRTDALPTFKWSTPLAPSETDPTKKVVDLTTSDDNAIAHEWSDLTISNLKKTYISTRWTFDDPILQSTYGSTRSLFTISSDDMYYLEENGDKVYVKPKLYDINFNPRYWRGSVYAYRMPKACNNNEQCREGTSTDSCMESYECRSKEGCPKYCAAGYCADGCRGGQVCVFGFCTYNEKWKTQTIQGDEGARTIFTFNPATGERVWFDTDQAEILKVPMGIDSTSRASDIIAWTRGTLYEGSAAGWSAAPATRKIIPSNETHDYDLHRPLNTESSEEDPILLLRERYGCSTRECAEDDDQCDEDVCSIKDSWLLGDVAHADPVYIGMRPSNSWTDLEPKPYSDYFNAVQYQRRKPVLLVAANDGMLHCFDAEYGNELWAFVPWDVLPKLKELARPFYEQLRTPIADLRPVVHDAYDAADGQWRTVLMVGTRGGGDHYWAMEITPPYGHLAPSDSEPDRARFLWYYADADLGLTYSIPTSGPVKTGEPAGPDDPIPSKWMAFFGSGYAPHSAGQMQKEGYFYAIDMFTTETSGYKAKLVAKKRISQAETGMYGFGDDEVTLKNNVLSSPTVADSDLDGLEDVVYIGDSVGHLLRFAIQPPATSSSHVVGQVLFNTFRAPSNPTDPGSVETALNAYTVTVTNRRLDETLGAASDQTYSYFKYPRPITVRPVVWRTTDPNDASTASFLGSADNVNRLMIFFGTGKYDAFYDSFDEYKRDPMDEACETWPYPTDCLRDFQSMFAVIDHQETGDDGRIAWADLLPNQIKDEELTTGCDKTGEKCLVRSIERLFGRTPTDAGLRGWYILFNSTFADNRGEKIITEPVAWEQENLTRSGTEARQREWILFFTTFTPNMQGTCDIRTVDGSGGGYLMSVSAESGGNPGFAIQDVTGNSLLTKTDSLSSGEGYAGQKFTGSILSRVDVDPYQKVLYVKTGPDRPVVRIQSSGLPYMRGTRTAIYRVR